MSEWLKEHAWKACVGETLPWVRIPLSPPAFAHRPREATAGLQNLPTSGLSSCSNFQGPFSKCFHVINIRLGVGTQRGGASLLQVPRPMAEPSKRGVYLLQSVASPAPDIYRQAVRSDGGDRVQITEGAVGLVCAPVWRSRAI